MRFEKWHGLGNAYLLVERADAGAPLAAVQVRRLCDVSEGIGADGVLEIVSADGAEVEVVIWNPDGSTAELSGNGTRIAARWLAEREGAEQVRVRVGPREIGATMRDGLEVETELGGVEVADAEIVDVGDETIEVTPVSVGNPHAVVAREPTREELLRLGPRLEHHRRFPDRTNVQLVRVDSGSELTVAVWERGAGVTRSSGTSAVAAAAAAVARGWCRAPVTVHLAGGDLLVELDEERRARLTGPAERICRGEISPGLLA
ncbi:MAG TPA: diaminopimelate epimerase [Gaiellaceae bacterium]